MKQEPNGRLNHILSLTLILLLLAIVGVTVMLVVSYSDANAAELTPVDTSRRVIEKSGDPTPMRPEADRPLAPYLVALGDDENPLLPLEGVDAEVDIAGMVAHVRLTQTYHNLRDKPIEAVYVFPMGRHAAVYKMVMQVGERRIEAQIKKRADARRTYEQARDAGKSAALLEQQRPNVFQMNVANILPGDEIRVTVDYVETLVPEDKIYEFVLPTVVGPRFHDKTAAQTPPSDRWVANPYLSQSSPPATRFSAKINLSAGMPIARIGSPSHDLDAEFKSESDASLSLPPQSGQDNRDLVLRYSLAGDAVQSGTLTYRDPDSGEYYFLTAVQPPERVESSAIVPRDYIFVVDVSGSMSGFPLSVSKALLRDLIGSLRPSDSFNVMLFASGNSVLSPQSLPATQANIGKAIHLIDNSHGGGGTQLLPALQRAMNLDRPEGVSRSIVVVTDGYISFEAEAFDVIRNNLNKANLFAFGIGSAVNRFLIEGMARAGQGEPAVILNQGEAKAAATRFRRQIERPVLTDIRIYGDSLDIVELEPPSVPDLFADKPIVVVGKLDGDVDGELVVEGRTADGLWKTRMAVSGDEVDSRHEALPKLWARARIQRLGDFVKLRADDARIAQITELGLAYSLMTAYTSFVAVDDRVRTDEKGETVVQPLPLPEGVSDQAVAASAGVMAVTGGGYGGGGVGLGGAGSRFAKLAMPRLEAEAPSVAEESATLDASAPKKAESKIDDTPAKAKTTPVFVDVQLAAGGSVDEAYRKVVLRTLKKKRANFAAIYRYDLQRNPNLYGKVTFVLKIDANGRVADVRMKTSTVKNADLEKRLLAALKRTIFSKPTGGASTELEISLILKPKL